MEETKCYCGHTTYCDCGPEEPKQETLEEAVELFFRKKDAKNCTLYKTAKFGAKWQQEQILDFLHSEITERRDYSASKMCEKIIEFIKNK